MCLPSRNTGAEDAGIPMWAELTHCLPPSRRALMNILMALAPSSDLRGLLLPEHYRQPARRPAGQPRLPLDISQLLSRRARSKFRKGRVCSPGIEGKLLSRAWRSPLRRRGPLRRSRTDRSSTRRSILPMTSASLKTARTVIYPWMLATISDLLEQYSFEVPPDQKLTVSYYRNKRL